MIFLGIGSGDGTVDDRDALIGIELVSSGAVCGAKVLVSRRDDDVVGPIGLIPCGVTVDDALLGIELISSGAVCGGKVLVSWRDDDVL